MNILLFGSTTFTGISFLELAKNNPNINTISFSRNKKDNHFVDFNNPDSFKIDGLDKNILINLGPIWLFADFLKSILNNPSIFGKISGIICCSSSSVLTKKYAFNNFDKNLVNKIENAENILKKLSKKCNLKLTIIRPTLIYGDLGKAEDKNFSQIIKIMRLLPFIIFPSETGLRQPIHHRELAKVIFKASLELNNFSENQACLRILNIGGSEEISYLNILRRIQNNLPKNDSARFCKIILIPNRIFYLLINFLNLYSSKTYESLLRVSANLSNFTFSDEFLNEKKKYFPYKE